MDAVLLARIQFAFTVGFHFIFPPLTIGLAWIISYIMWKYVKTNDQHYLKIARFWVRLFAINFAVGVATGITMEFQFGTNWSEYSRYVGDIFGAPLAAEGIFAFFLESTFFGVLLFGWNRLSKKTLWFSSLMVAIGSTLSAFWIIVANSWMQTPSGYHIIGGRAELTNFWAAVFNPSTFPRYFHTVTGALITGAFFVLGVSAWFILKGKDTEFAKSSFRTALIIGFIVSVAQLGMGHWHAIQVSETQPEKFAAVEGHFETTNGASALIFGIPDYDEGKVHIAIKIPKLLSLLATGNPNARIKGLNDFPKDEWPPIILTFYPFHLMVLLGMYFILITLIGVFLLRKGTLFDNRFILKAAVWSIPLPFLANELGWFTAEVGRQPWIVYHILKTDNAVSITVPAWQVGLSLLIFIVVYALLFYAWFSLIKKEMKKGFDLSGSVKSSSAAY